MYKSRGQLKCLRTIYEIINKPANRYWTHKSNIMLAIYFQVILGNTNGRQIHVRFVYKGECVMVRRVILKKTKELKIRHKVAQKNIYKPPSSVSVVHFDIYDLLLLLNVVQRMQYVWIIWTLFVCRILTYVRKQQHLSWKLYIGWSHFIINFRVCLIKDYGRNYTYNFFDRKTVFIGSCDTM